MISRRALAIAILFASCLSAQPLAAQSLAGVPRLSIQTPLAELAHVNAAGDDAQAAAATRVSIGPRSALGFGLSVGVVDRLMLGADVWLGHESSPREPATGGFVGGGAGQLYNINQLVPLANAVVLPVSERWSAQVAPHIELVIGGGVVRPMLALAGLVGFHRDTLEVGTWSSVTKHVNALQLGASLIGGAHFFLSERFSFDAALRMSYAHTTWFVDRELTARSFGVAATVGLSGWIR